MSETTDRITTWATILSCVFLAAAAAVTIRTLRSLREATALVVHTQEVIVGVEELRFNLKEAESSSRGFVLTAEADFARAFEASRSRVFEGAARLRELTSDNPGQQKRLAELEPVLRQRTEISAEAIRLRGAEGLVAAQRFVAVGAGAQLMGEAMRVLATLRREEEALLARRNEQAAAQLRLVYLAIAAGLVASVGLSVWPILALRRQLRERDTARATLQESAGKIRDLYDNAPCGYCSVEDSGRILAINRTLCAWLSLSAENLSQMPALPELCEPGSRAGLRRWLEGADSAEAIKELEVEFLRKEGGVLPALLSASRVPGGAGVGHWRMTVVDLRERKRTEAVVARARDQAESMVNTVRHPLVLLTEDLRIASANRAFYELFETDQISAAGRLFEDVAGGQWARPELLRTLEDVLPKQRVMENFELSINLPKESRRIFALNAQKLFRPGNHTTLILLAIEEITERWKTQMLHRQFRALFESLPGRYLVLTPDFTIVAASDAYLVTTMITREHAIGKPLFEVFPDNPGDAAANGTDNLRASLERVLRAGAADTMAVQRYDIRRPDGTFEERHWSPVNSPVFGDDKKIEYIIHRVEDVTALVMAEKSGGASAELDAARRGAADMEGEVLMRSRELGLANRQLRALNEELEAFSYSVSHDLRAPLRHIAGFADMLTQHAAAALDEKGRRYLSTIIDSAGRMGRLIDDLLAFSRMGRAEMRQQKVSLQELVAGVRQGLKEEAAGRSIEWRVGPLPEVRGDASMLRQVFSNLLGNALKYSRHSPEARIEIGSRMDGADQVEIHVRDNGAGFDMKYAPKLFGVFQRLHSASEFEGTGVGLALVRRIVQRHGGRTWAEGAIGKGATFFFTLPHSTPAATEPSPPQQT